MRKHSRNTSFEWRGSGDRLCRLAPDTFDRNGSFSFEGVFSVETMQAVRMVLTHNPVGTAIQANGPARQFPVVPA
jgi:hypothetical protein